MASPERVQFSDDAVSPGAARKTSPNRASPTSVSRTASQAVMLEASRSLDDDHPQEVVFRWPTLAEGSESKINPGSAHMPRKTKSGTEEGRYTCCHNVKDGAGCVTRSYHTQEEFQCVNCGVIFRDDENGNGVCSFHADDIGLYNPYGYTEWKCCGMTGVQNSKYQTFAHLGEKERELLRSTRYGCRVGRHVPDPSKTNPSNCTLCGEHMNSPSNCRFHEGVWCPFTKVVPVSPSKHWLGKDVAVRGRKRNKRTPFELPFKEDAVEPNGEMTLNDSFVGSIYMERLGDISADCLYPQGVPPGNQNIMYWKRGTFKVRMGLKGPERHSQFWYSYPTPDGEIIRSTADVVMGMWTCCRSIKKNGSECVRRRNHPPDRSVMRCKICNATYMEARNPPSFQHHKCAEPEVLNAMGHIKWPCCSATGIWDTKYVTHENKNKRMELFNIRHGCHKEKHYPMFVGSDNRCKNGHELSTKVCCEQCLCPMCGKEYGEHSRRLEEIRRVKDEYLSKVREAKRNKKKEKELRRKAQHEEHIERRRKKKEWRELKEQKEREREERRRIRSEQRLKEMEDKQVLRRARRAKREEERLRGRKDEVDDEDNDGSKEFATSTTTKKEDPSKNRNVPSLNQESGLECTETLDGDLKVSGHEVALKGEDLYDEIDKAHEDSESASEGNSDDEDEDKDGDEDEDEDEDEDAFSDDWDSADSAEEFMKRLAEADENDISDVDDELGLEPATPSVSSIGGETTDSEGVGIDMPALLEEEQRLQKFIGDDSFYACKYHPGVWVPFLPVRLLAGTALFPPPPPMIPAYKNRLENKDGFVLEPIAPLNTKPPLIPQEYHRDGVVKKQPEMPFVDRVLALFSPPVPQDKSFHAVQPKQMPEDMINLLRLYPPQVPKNYVKRDRIYLRHALPLLDTLPQPLIANQVLKMTQNPPMPAQMDISERSERPKFFYESEDDKVTVWKEPLWEVHPDAEMVPPGPVPVPHEPSPYSQLRMLKKVFSPWRELPTEKEEVPDIVTIPPPNLPKKYFIFKAIDRRRGKKPKKKEPWDYDQFIGPPEIYPPPVPVQVHADDFGCKRSLPHKVIPVRQPKDRDEGFEFVVGPPMPVHPRVNFPPSRGGKRWQSKLWDYLGSRRDFKRVVEGRDSMKASISEGKKAMFGVDFTNWWKEKEMAEKLANVEDSQLSFSLARVVKAKPKMGGLNKIKAAKEAMKDYLSVRRSAGLWSAGNDVERERDMIDLIIKDEYRKIRELWSEYSKRTTKGQVTASSVSEDMQKAVIEDILSGEYMRLLQGYEMHRVQLQGGETHIYDIDSVQDTLAEVLHEFSPLLEKRPPLLRADDLPDTDDESDDRVAEVEWINTNGPIMKSPVDWSLCPPQPPPPVPEKSMLPEPLVEFWVETCKQKYVNLINEIRARMNSPVVLTVADVDEDEFVFSRVRVKEKTEPIDFTKVELPPPPGPPEPEQLELPDPIKHYVFVSRPKQPMLMQPPEPPDIKKLRKEKKRFVNTRGRKVPPRGPCAPPQVPHVCTLTMKTRRAVRRIGSMMKPPMPFFPPPPPILRRLYRKKKVLAEKDVPMMNHHIHFSPPPAPIMQKNFLRKFMKDIKPLPLPMAPGPPIPRLDPKKTKNLDRVLSEPKMPYSSGHPFPVCGFYCLRRAHGGTKDPESLVTREGVPPWNTDQEPPKKYKRKPASPSKAKVSKPTEKVEAPSVERNSYMMMVPVNVHWKNFADDIVESTRHVEEHCWYPHEYNKVMLSERTGELVSGFGSKYHNDGVHSGRYKDYHHLRRVNYSHLSFTPSTIDGSITSRMPEPVAPQDDGGWTIDETFSNPFGYGGNMPNTSQLKVTSRGKKVRRPWSASAVRTRGQQWLKEKDVRRKDDEASSKLARARVQQGYASDIPSDNLRSFRTGFTLSTDPTESDNNKSIGIKPSENWLEEKAKKSLKVHVHPRPASHIVKGFRRMVSSPKRPIRPKSAMASSRDQRDTDSAESTESTYFSDEESSISGDETPRDSVFESTLTRMGVPPSPSSRAPAETVTSEGESSFQYTPSEQSTTFTTYTALSELDKAAEPVKKLERSSYTLDYPEKPNSFPHYKKGYSRLLDESTPLAYQEKNNPVDESRKELAQARISTLTKQPDPFSFYYPSGQRKPETYDSNVVDMFVGDRPTEEKMRGRGRVDRTAIPSAYPMMRQWTAASKEGHWEHSFYTKEKVVNPSNRNVVGEARRNPFIALGGRSLK